MALFRLSHGTGAQEISSGGHQRISQLDALEGKKNYSLDVCVIDVDEKEEALLNVQLNNPSMQGEWDLDKLEELNADFDIGWDAMGFTKNDLMFMFDDDNIIAATFDPEDVKEEKEKIRNVKEERAKSLAQMQEDQQIDWYCVIVFEDQKEKRAFYKNIKAAPYEMYFTQEQIMRLVNTAEKPARKSTKTTRTTKTKQTKNRTKTKE